jgi:probable F420-dependent oxidoreductase
MFIGLGAPIAGAWADAYNLEQFCRQAETLGYHSIWTFQRLLFAPDREPQSVYRSSLDPIVALAFAAARTSRVRLGVAVVGLPFVSPTLLAKQAATLDVLSGGRLDLGLGTGWSPTEFTATGASPFRRGRRTEEYVAALHVLWSAQPDEFKGEFYRIPRSVMAPAPAQRPGPPVLLGGSAPAALRRAGRIAAGWISPSDADLSRIGESVALVRAGAAEAGRDPASVRIVCRGVVHLDTTRGRRSPLLSGSYRQIREDTRRLAEQGVTELFYDLNWDPRLVSPGVDSKIAAQRATEVIKRLAPGTSGKD